MSNEQTVFKQEEGNQPQQPNQAEGGNENNSSLTQLVGEGKKFNDTESLAKGKLESDKHIGHLEEQLKELTEELGKRDTAKEIAEQLRNERQTAPVAAPTTPGMTADEVAAIVQNTMTESETKRTYTANALEADRMFKQAHGEKATEVLQAKANELGMSLSDLEKVAGKSPTAFANMVGLSQGQSAPRGDQAPMEGDQNNQAAHLNQGGQLKEGSAAYWSAQRKELGQKYWEPKIQQQIIKDKEEGRYDA